MNSIGWIAIGAAGLAAVAGVSAVAAWNSPIRADILAVWADQTLGEHEAFDGKALLDRREESRQAIMSSLGEQPAVQTGTVTVTESSERAGSEGAKLVHVSYPLSEGDSGVALVGYPDGDAKPRGLVIALHQTADVGMQEPMGAGGDPTLAYGEVLRRAGYMVIAPDAFAAGERSAPAERWLTGAFYQRHPRWSAMGKMLADNETALSVGIDAYQQRYGTAPTCIAAVGHSLGAHNALFLAAFDDRVDAVIANAGFERIASDTDAIRWARDGGFIYMPALTKATRGQEDLPWDWEDVLVQVYPRDTMIIQGLEDPIFTREISVAQAARAAESAYKAGGHADRFEAHFWSGGHAFPKRYQEAAGAWIETACSNGD